MGPNKYPRDIRCIWGWLLRGPHPKGATIFPMINTSQKVHQYMVTSTYCEDFSFHTQPNLLVETLTTLLDICVGPSQNPINSGFTEVVLCSNTLTWHTWKYLFWSTVITAIKKKGILLILNIGVSKNNDTTKSSILIGFSIINHPFWGTPIFGNIHIYICSFFLNFRKSPMTCPSPDPCWKSEKKIPVDPLVPPHAHGSNQHTWHGLLVGI